MIRFSDAHWRNITLWVRDGFACRSKCSTKQQMLYSLQRRSSSWTKIGSDLLISRITRAWKRVPKQKAMVVVSHANSFANDWLPIEATLLHCTVESRCATVFSTWPHPQSRSMWIESIAVGIVSWDDDDLFSSITRSFHSSNRSRKVCLDLSISLHWLLLKGQQISSSSR
jgi:hypothetical protein